eukprot:1159803-Pelagomonas_calceolata.AAC.4
MLKTRTGNFLCQACKGGESVKNKAPAFFPRQSWNKQQELALMYPAHLASNLCVLHILCALSPKLTIYTRNCHELSSI